MKDNYKNMEDLFSESLGDFAAEINSDGWQAIARGTSRKLFFRFVPKRFNIYYLAAGVVLAVSVGTTLLINNGTGDELSAPVENNNIPQMQIPEEGTFTNEDAAENQEDNSPEESPFEEETKSEEVFVEESVSEETNSEQFNEPVIDNVANDLKIDDQGGDNQPIIDEDFIDDAEPISEEIEDEELKEVKNEGTILQFDTEIIEEPIEDEIPDSSVPSSTVKDSINNRKPDTVIKKEEKIHYIEKLKKTRRKNK